MPLGATDLERFEEAESALAAHRFAEARQKYSEYLRARQEVIERPDDYRAPDAIAIERLANLSVHFGAEQAAEDLFDALSGIYRRAGNACGEQFARLRSAHTRLVRGRLRDALAVLDALAEYSGDLEGITITPTGLRRWEDSSQWPACVAQERSVLFALWYLLLGRLFGANGQFGPAEILLRRGLEHARAEAAGGYRHTLALSLARVRFERGALTEALEDLDGIGGSTETPEAIAVLELKGQILLSRGELGAAKRAYEEAVRIADALVLPAAAGAARVALANLLILINQTEGAHDVMRPVFPLVRDLGLGDLGQRLKTASLLANLRRRSDLAIAASVIELQSEPAGIEPLAAIPLAQIPELPGLPPQESFLGTFDDRIVELHGFLARRDAARAAELLRVLEAFSDTDSTLIQARLKTARALVRYLSGDTESATSLFSEALSAMTSLGLAVESRQVHRYLIWCAARAGNQAMLEAHRAAETDLLSRLAGSLNNADQGSFWLNKWTQEEEGFSAAAAVLDQLQDRCERSRGLYKLWNHARLWWRLARFLDSMDRHRNWKARQAIGAEDRAYGHARPFWWRCLQFPATRASINFLVLPDRVVAAAVWRFGCKLRIEPVTRIALREGVRDIHRRIVEFDETLPENEGLTAFATALGVERLLAAVPDSVQALHVVPDDSLHGVPFPALRLNDRPLIDLWAIMLSGSWLPRVDSGNVSTGLLVSVADPGHGFSRLRFAGQEIACAARFCPARGTRIIQEREATADMVNAILPGLSLFHAACHGIAVPNEPGASGLVLGDGGPAERLTLRALARMPLHSVQMAYLAACWSADSFQLPGRYVVSLPQAMLLAGARTVAASIWEVLDEVGLAFANRFYSELGDGVPREQAFRRAIQFCRLGPEGRERPAADWAGFVLSGAGGVLKMEGQ